MFIKKTKLKQKKKRGKRSDDRTTGSSTRAKDKEKEFLQRTAGLEQHKVRQQKAFRQQETGWDSGRKIKFNFETAK